MPPAPGRPTPLWGPGSNRKQPPGSHDGASSQHDVLTGNPLCLPQAWCGGFVVVVTSAR